MAAYRTAGRLFVGCHLPALCTGMEYLRTNNLKLAEQFCAMANELCPTDPLLHNELGVVHFRNKRYAEAAEAFERALELCGRHGPPMPTRRVKEAWEPILFNLGHAHRKRGKYNAAADCYRRALACGASLTGCYSGISEELWRRYLR